MHVYQCTQYVQYVYIPKKVTEKIVLEDIGSLIKNKDINRQLAWFHQGKVLP